MTTPAPDNYGPCPTCGRNVQFGTDENAVVRPRRHYNPNGIGWCPNPTAR